MRIRPLIALACVDATVGRELVEHLQRRGYDTRLANNAWETDALLATSGCDVAVIGEGIPSSTMRELLRRYGEDGPAFVIISAPGDLLETVLALELGAADVVENPVVVRELATRIGGLLARRGRGTPELLVLESVTVDLRSALVMHSSGEEDLLSPGQIALLRLFLANPRKVLTRDDIMAAAPAENADAFDRSIDSRIVRLRRKLGTESITTIRGSGYRFDPPATLKARGGEPPQHQSED